MDSNCSVFAKFQEGKVFALRLLNYYENWTFQSNGLNTKGNTKDSHVSDLIPCLFSFQPVNIKCLFALSLAIYFSKYSNDINQSSVVAQFFPPLVFIQQVKNMLDHVKIKMTDDDEYVSS